ncbi:hypothetical protein A3L11_08495 [Thermococcus siculi]|uniref:GGDEF domain-containing protein n=1 Tax=Thermococcus siculi TaxID=72803 RepID=A0A2Z2MR93_9EURY|nr:type III-B CRISPR-associated protein Cas10/Cmr2 [Thermococcus siculi]ASJ09264.1 hypothetical protein A3L11_08495 [Thermococcus siculi]
MKISHLYATSLLEAAPSKILDSLIDDKESPLKWRQLSSYPVVNQPKNEKIELVLKHPISTEEKSLEKLTEFLRNASKEKIDKFLKVLEGAEKVVADRIEHANSVEEFARLWNNLPEDLQKGYKQALRSNGFPPDLADELVHLPADPLMPDHDWLSRLDVYAALKSDGARLLRFKLSPVQGFIGNARTERDLWAGSHLLSLLTYLTISVIWRKFGPNAVVFPHLRGQPFFEHELGILYDTEKLRIGNMPNKVLAIVPRDVDIGELENEVKDEITNFLERLVEGAWKFYNVNERLKEDLGRYKELVKRHFSITVEEIPLVSLKPEEVISGVLQDYLKAIPNEVEHPIHSYSELFLLLDQATDFKSRDYIRPEEPMGFKCTLCGEHLAIGGNDDHSNVRQKWKGFVESLHNRGIYDIKIGERLCPLCLAKRFYPRFYELWKNNYSVVHSSNYVVGHKRSFRSVSEVAMARPTENAIKLAKTGELYVKDSNKKTRPVSWADIYEEIQIELRINNEPKHEFGGTRAKELKEAIDKLKDALSIPFNELAPNSEIFYVENLSDLKSLAKIYGTNENDDRLRRVSVDAIRVWVEKLSDLMGEPPKYYAILKMDGDNMGKVISGTKAVKSLKEYAHGSVTNQIPGITRPVTPTIHIAITRSLSNFAVNIVPGLSEIYRAELLYAGGDDVFALVPADTAVSLAHKLQENFREEWRDFKPLQGRTRSMSAGILFVYYKEPLYSAVRRVNELEHLAKGSGRNALAIGYLKHSGSYYNVSLNWWVFGEPLRNLLRELGEENSGLSNRIVYEIAEGIEVWPNDPGAVVNLLKYEIERHSNYRNDKKAQEVFKRLAEFLWVARNVRVTLSEGDLRAAGLKELASEKVLKRLNRTIEKIIVDDPENKEPSDEYVKIEAELKKFLTDSSESLWFMELKNQFRDIVSEEVSKKLAGVVLRKQLRGAAHLLKVLREMGVSS